MNIYEHTSAAIEAAGVPAYYQEARRTARRPEIPDTYAVYTRLVTNSPVGADNEDLIEAHYVRVDIYSPLDPASAVAAVRQSMRAAGFLIRDERDIAEADGYHINLSTVYHEEVTQ